DDHFLKVEIDIAGGSAFVDMGTTQFKTVPYAINAETANNVTGLEAIDEGNGIGWRIIGVDPEDYGNIGEHATDLSYSIYGGNIGGAIGNNAVAMGFNTTASGNTSTAMGGFTTASGRYATALGFGTEAPSHGEVVVGTYNEIYTPNDVVAFNENDRAFVVGNGIPFTPSNALTVLKNGTITAPSFDISEITDDKALVTKEYLEANASSGLEAIDEGNGIGWRLIGVAPNSHGNIGENAIDLSDVTSPNAIYGATGNNAVAMGLDTTASGNNSTSIGQLTLASGDNSVAMGTITVASGGGAVAMGLETTASGITSTTMGGFTEASGTYAAALGYGTKASSFGEIVVGTFNENYTPNSVTVFNENDRVFVVGNGMPVTPSNALTVLKNGTITAPSFDISEITDDKALVTKEYVDTTKGLEALDEGNGIGYRLIGKNPSLYGTIGLGAIDFSNSIIPSTLGATGEGSLCFGDNNLSSGESSLAGGSFSQAEGDTSTALGFNAKAIGQFSTAIGSGVNANARNSFAIGRYNVGGGNSVSWVTTDPLFEIGNGASNATRNNALTVLKNGNVGIVSETPQAKLHISSGADTGLGNNNGYLLLGQTNGTNISLDNNEIMAKNNGVAADLNLQIEGGNLNIGDGNVNMAGTLYLGDETIRDAGNNALRINAALLPDVDNTSVLGNPSQRWTTVYATNGTINTSDRREKKNIKELNYGLTEVLQMQPVSFNWKSENNPDLKLGLIAQDLQELIPEVVKSHFWEKDEATNQLSKKELERLGVYYSDLVPVLIKAIQEQQSIIEKQENNIKALVAKDSEKETALHILNKRIAKLEEVLDRYQ
ncbi:tail fiber domain-containing protein, partial [Xanthomarina sp. F2636L]|uniref:tail fiber domain-containing protein n=1 Tax=Xanthomarina sp. F2636L TaxID=2996018 RepID=UPI00225E0592